MCFCNRLKVIAFVLSYNLEVLLYKVLSIVNAYVHSVSVAVSITSQNLSYLTMKVNKVFSGKKSSSLDEKWCHNSSLRSLVSIKHVLSSENMYI